MFQIFNSSVSDTVRRLRVEVTSRSECTAMASNRARWGSATMRWSSRNATNRYRSGFCRRTYLHAIGANTVLVPIITFDKATHILWKSFHVTKLFVNAIQPSSSNLHRNRIFKWLCFVCLFCFNPFCYRWREYATTIPLSIMISW